MPEAPQPPPPPLEQFVHEVLNERYEAGLELYEKHHRPIGGILYTLLQVWTEEEDWADLVKPHKEALARQPQIVAALRERIEEEPEAMSKTLVERLLDSALLDLRPPDDAPHILLQGIVEPYEKTDDGVLVRAMSVPWRWIIDALSKDWSAAFEISFEQWEQLIAAAFDKAGYDEVTLTPRSGDFGRDVIAVKKGVGSVRIIGSVKAFKPDHLVKHDDVRALAGVLHGDPGATKGIVTTTSDFAPNIATDPFLAPLMPYRLEMLNGAALKSWLASLRDA